MPHYRHTLYGRSCVLVVPELCFSQKGLWGDAFPYTSVKCQERRVQSSFDFRKIRTITSARLFDIFDTSKQPAYIVHRPQDETSSSKSVAGRDSVSESSLNESTTGNCFPQTCTFAVLRTFCNRSSRSLANAAMLRSCPSILRFRSWHSCQGRISGTGLASGTGGCDLQRRTQIFGTQDCVFQPCAQVVDGGLLLVNLLV